MRSSQQMSRAISWSSPALWTEVLEAQDRIARGGGWLAALRALTFVMKIDVLLFGRVRSGPFFALLEKRAE